MSDSKSLGLMRTFANRAQAAWSTHQNKDKSQRGWAVENAKLSMESKLAWRRYREARDTWDREHGFDGDAKQALAKARDAVLGLEEALAASYASTKPYTDTIMALAEMVQRLATTDEDQRKVVDLLGDVGLFPKQIVLTDSEFKHMQELIDNPPEPSPALVELMKEGK